MIDPSNAPPSSASRVPEPPHPIERRASLPAQRPKPAADDPGAPERVRAIMANPSYLEADRDVAFLNRDAARGVRLQLDFLKAELLLEQHGILHTIVVFGSNRFAEPASAQRDLDALRDAIAAGDDSNGTRAALRRAERVLANSRYYDVAREFGRLVGTAAKEAGGTLTVVTGGGPGIMEAANRGAYDVGAPNIGLNIVLPQEQYPNPYVTPELCFQFHYFAIRKLHFLLRARALVAFPGGYGTLDELFETLALVQTRKIAPIPVVLVGEAYWRRVFDIDFLVAEGAIDPEDRELFWFAETAQGAWSGIVDWYARTGRTP